jgi:hypothetical protein|tara:strand:+ start:905 stop:1798 length:894 start_codon:yes stop_codon:yes gene_type:complete
MENSKYFKNYVGLSALLIAGSAAFFSVFGLSKLFSGAALSVIIMAGSLEFGKLVAASFLYRYWNSINNLLKGYLLVGVVTLVLITSAGIFGYLSNAYQGATVTFEKQTTELLALDDRLEQLEDDKVFLKEELDIQVESLPENYITAKRKLREQFNPQIQQVNQEILNIKSRKSDLEISLIETGVDVGPAIFLARTFDTDVDTVVKFFIFILIFVFDPMAVSLVIAYNRILEDDKEERNKVDKLFTEYKTNKPKRDNQRTKKKVKQTKRKKSDEREISDDDDYLITEKQVSRGGIAGR